ncbi:hypothetical protein B0T14DRAFT_521495 [Immersiella caudata]|uniref:NACHT domain-containing protein n=1 Tax=Immersiella caudata TaxID=314043 RepID=A0AA39WRX1_9PEZI|nr:hypothetical protein B0T14DRAFT_521495 [Immersiella caudata]
MEPFTALGLAGNITQFVDFSCRLLSQAKEIRQSGSVAQVQNVTEVAQQLALLSSKLAIDTPSENLSTLAKSLRALAAKCNGEAAEIIAALDKYQSRNLNPSKWSSIRAALSVVWSKDKIEQMSRRLDQNRQEMAFHLNALQDEKQSALMHTLDRLHQDNIMLQSSMPREIDALRSSLYRALELLKTELRQPCRGESTSGGSNTRVESAAASLSQNARTANGMAIASSILQSLRFSSMKFRHSKIPDAHTNTFQWMLSEKFAAWLRSNDPIFWLSGKPGSGKSTCMKFLANNEETTEKCLRYWARNRRLVTVRSQEGLFQSLLYDILRLHPQLISSTFPSLWADAQDKPLSDTAKHEWERKELLDGLTVLLGGQHLSTCFYISIDGLDEYDGDHEELVTAVKNLVQANNVKLCVASRPWNVFETAFGVDQLQKIYLEQFNRPDIELYVKDLLENRQDFQAMMRKEPDAQTLPEEVVSNSQGVFLWVYLVVRSLVRGLQNRDRLRDLQRRLRAFPSDLDEFFNHMLMSLEDIYRVQAARNFQVALSSPRPLSLLNYWYIDTEEGDPDYYDDLQVAGLDIETVTEIQEDMRIRINGRSKGLLEVTPSAHPDPPFNLLVDFLHRTVKDFLLTKGAQNILKKWSEAPEAANGPEGGEFDVFRTLCTSSVAELKTAPIRAFPRVLCEPEHISELVSVVLISAQSYEQRTGETLFTLLVDLERTIPQRYLSGAWTETASSLEEHALQWGLRIFVAKKLADFGHVPSRRKSLLVAACRCRYDDEGKMMRYPDPNMVELVVKTGPRIALETWEMNRLTSCWRSPADKWQKKVTADSVYSSLMLIFTNCDINVGIADLGRFWQNVGAVVRENELVSLRGALRPTTAASRMFSTFGRWTGLVGND